MHRINKRNIYLILLSIVLILAGSNKGEAKSTTAESDEKSPYYIKGYELIKSQLAFERFLSKSNKDTVLRASLVPGEYYLPCLEPIRATLSIIGNGSVIKGTNKVYTKRNAVSHTSTHYVCKAENIGVFSSFFDRSGKPIRVSEETEDSTYVNFIPGDIECIEDKDTSSEKTVRFKIPQNLKHLKNQKFRKVFAYVDSWWTSPIFEITQSDSLYFYGKTLRDWFPVNNTESYINGERKGYRQDARMVIYNTEVQEDRINYDDKYIYVPIVIDEVECVDFNSEFCIILLGNASIQLSDITFKNINRLINTKKGSKGKIDIRNCRFHNIMRDVIHMETNSKISELNVSNSEFIDCSQIENSSTIYVNSKPCIVNIEDCLFNRYTDDFCTFKNVLEGVLINDCDSAFIMRNTFINYPRGAVFLRDGMIIAEENILYNTEAFNAFPDRNFSRDGGAIYCCQLFKSDDIFDNKRNIIKLKHNRINNVIGRGDVRGIFIDDGRGDVSCIGNIILNSQCYSIDSRNISSRPYSSIRNNYQYNIVDLPYRLGYGNEVTGKDIPTSNNNLILLKESDSCLANALNPKDQYCTEYSEVEGEVYVKKRHTKSISKEVKKMIRIID